jgi:hypothetical protein
MMGHLQRRRRSLFSDSTESTRGFANYDVGLDGEEDDSWPKIEGEDNFILSVVDPNSYTVLQKFCKKPVEYVDAGGCNCSGEHVCLELEKKQMIATTSNPFSTADTFSVWRSDWCANKDLSEVSGCSCEWRNKCDFVVYASPRMSITCGVCP